MINWNPGTPSESTQGCALNVANSQWAPGDTPQRNHEIGQPPEPEKIDNRIAWLRERVTGFGAAYDAVLAAKEHEAQNRAEMMEKGAI